MLSRLRQEHGQSLIELLVTILVGGIVLAGIVEVTTSSLQAFKGVNDRVESTERARVAVDRLLTTLNSQVCLDALTAPIVVGSTKADLTFYADLAPKSDTTLTSQRIVRMTYDAAANTITERRWTGSTMSGAAAKTIVTTGVTAPAGGPFSFYEYTPASSVGGPSPTQLITPASPGGLTADDVADIVRVRVDLVQTTRRTNTTDGRSSTVGGDAYVGSLDPFNPEAGARCSA